MATFLSRAILTIGALVLSPAAFAQDSGAQAKKRPVIVELFSSQSCGSCPTANRNVAALAKQDDIIALTYPVGYWNYLGWDDTFAKPKFTERQKAYNRNLKHRGPYTPQIVFSGIGHSSGVKLKLIREKLDQRNFDPHPFDVRLKTGKVIVDKKPGVEFDGAASVVLVRFRPGTTTVTPKGGENRNKPMSYFNLVTDFEVLGEWTGKRVEYSATCQTGCTVLVQRGSAIGRVIGAAEGR